MSENDNNETEYKVGYAKPPEHTRFQSGTSGNPKGRPKGGNNFISQFGKELNSKMKVRIGEEVVSISKLGMAIKRLIQRAHEGHLPSIKLLMDLALRFEKEKPENVQQQNMEIGLPAMLKRAKELRKEKEEREEKERQRLERKRLKEELADNACNNPHE